MKVKLQDVIDGITYANAGAQFFYNTKTGEVHLLMDNIYGISRDRSLEKAIEKNPGNAAQRLFKQSVQAFDLEKEWLEFRNGCYDEIARLWCDENQIEYEE